MSRFSLEAQKSPKYDKFAGIVQPHAYKLFSLNSDDMKTNKLCKIFSTAGTKAGLEIWKVSNFNLIPIPRSDFGKFHEGDCYLVLFTDLHQAGLHLWIGKDSTADEFGAAALISSQMTANLTLAPTLFREQQGNESEIFKKYFKKLPSSIVAENKAKFEAVAAQADGNNNTDPPETDKSATGEEEDTYPRNGIEYLSGGVDSCARHTVVNQDDDCRLLMIKGIKRKIHIQEVPFTWKSVTNDDVFIFEIGPDLFRWKGQAANMFEWLESAYVCSSILENEQNGRGQIFNLTSEDEFPVQIIQKLGAAPSTFPKSEISDFQFQANLSKPDLYKVISDGYICIGATPNLNKSMLESTHCYFLDNHDKQNIYIWKGSDSPCSDKVKVVEFAKKFIAEKGYNDSRICCYLENHESQLFTQFFTAW